ncbi:MAG: trypsin-like serine protease [Gemmataceae bacterium]|nr:trypsin-like serine protease [Gemmataceae bacterium]
MPPVRLCRQHDPTDSAAASPRVPPTVAPPSVPTDPLSVRVSNACVREAPPPCPAECWGEPEPPFGDDAFTDPDYLAWRGAAAEPVGRDHPPPIGPADDRRRVVTTDQPPWRWVCWLRAVWLDGRGFPVARVCGTGWLAGPRAVVTAGHCLYHRDFGWARRVEVYPGRDGPGRQSTHVSDDLHAVAGWTEGQRLEYDYGAVRLAEPVRHGGCFRWAALPDDRLRTLAFSYLAGYPSDRPAGTLWVATGRLAGVRDRTLRYPMASAAGQSGGPVFYRDGADRVAVGVHAYGPADKAAGVPRADLANLAVRVTPDVAANLAAWAR